MVIDGTTCSVSHKSHIIEEGIKKKKKSNESYIFQKNLSKSTVLQFLGVELSGSVLTC